MTDAALRYLVEVEDRDLKDLQKRVKETNRYLGQSEAAGKKGARGLDLLGASGRKAGKLLGGVTKAAKYTALAVGAGAVGGLAAVLKSGISEFKESAKVSAQTSAALKSTGGVANVTARDIEKLGSSLQAVSGQGDETIRTGANMLLTFTKIRNEAGKGNDIFNQATEATLDMSVAMGQDMKSSAILVGKALNDPVKGATALSRAGVQLTEQQRKQIAAFVESGDVLGAQKILLGELTTQFGGSAKAFGDTVPGQIAKAKEAFGDFSGTLVEMLVPSFVAVLGAVNRNMPAIQRVLTAVFAAIGTAADRMISWFRTNWPTIQRVARATFDAIRSAWTSALKPTLTAIAAAIGWLVQQAVKHWPRIRAAAETVMKWYRTNLQPTITSVVETIGELWDRFGGKITAVAQASFGILKTIVGGALRNMKLVIDGVLAVLRGDWGKAWEALKGIVRNTLGTLGSVAKQTISKLIPGMVSLGWDMLRGIGKGLRDGANSVIRSAIEWATDKIPGWAKKVLGISSPSTVMEDQVGKPIAQGIAKGIRGGTPVVTDAMVDLAEAAAAKAESAFGSRFSTFTSFAQRAFQRLQGTVLTKSEKKLAAIEAKRERERLDRSVEEGRAALDAARSAAGAFVPEEGMSVADAEARRRELEQAVLEAERQFQDAKLDLQVAKLREQAEQERVQLEHRQFVQQQNYEKRLDGLQRYLESSRVTAAGATKRIRKLLKDFGLDLAELGLDVGKLFAKGLRDSIPAVVAAAIDMRESANKAKVVTAASKAQAAAEKVKTTSTSSGSRGATGASTGPSGSLVSVGRWLQSHGFQVWEHPAFGGVKGRHSPNSYHYAGRAIDVNWPGGGATELAKLRWAFGQLGGGFVEKMIEDVGSQNQHMHLAMARGGIVPGALLGDTGIHARRQEAVLPLESAHGRRALAAAFADAIGDAGGGFTMHVDTLNVRNDDDIYAVGSAVWRELSIR